MTHNWHILFRGERPIRVCSLITGDRRCNPVCTWDMSYIFSSSNISNCHLGLRMVIQITWRWTSTIIYISLYMADLKGWCSMLMTFPQQFWQQDGFFVCCRWLAVMPLLPIAFGWSVNWVNSSSLVFWIIVFHFTQFSILNAAEWYGDPTIQIWLFLYSKYGSVWDLFCDPSRATSLEDVSWGSS